MQRRILLCFLLSTILALFLFGCNDKESHSLRIGILGGIGPKGPSIAGFIKGMSDAGYVEGENVDYDIRTPDFDLDAHREILSEFIDDDVDLIFVYPTETALIAREMTRNTGIPMIFSISFTENNDLIDSLISPGEGITGVRHPGVDIIAKRYEVFRILMPEMKSLGFIYQRGGALIEEQLDMIRKTTQLDHVNLIELPSDTPESLVQLLKEQMATGTAEFDALLLPVGAIGGDPAVFSYLNELSDLYNIPFGGQFFGNLPGNSLFRVEINYYDSGLLAASLAAKVLQGTPAGNLPVLSSNLFLTINYIQTEKMGIEVPQWLLLESDEIVSE